MNRCLKQYTIVNNTEGYILSGLQSRLKYQIYILEFVHNFIK